MQSDEDCSEDFSQNHNVSSTDNSVPTPAPQPRTPSPLHHVSFHAVPPSSSPSELASEPVSADSTDSSPLPSTTARATLASPAAPLALEVAEDMETLWYAERAFPPFAVYVVDPLTRSPRPDCEGLSIAVSLLDAYGRCINDKLGPSDKIGPSDRLRHLPLTRGAATVAGLRFHAVSSKNGGSRTRHSNIWGFSGGFVVFARNGLT